MIHGDQHFACPGPCSRCAHMTMNTGDCDRRLNPKPPRPHPEYVVTKTKDGTVARRIRRRPARSYVLARTAA